MIEAARVVADELADTTPARSTAVHELHDTLVLLNWIVSVP